MQSEKPTWLDKIPTKSELRNKAIKANIEHIASGGISNHSAMGSTLFLTLKRLEQAGVSYQLTAHPKYGYTVQGLPREEWMDKE